MWNPLARFARKKAEIPTQPQTGEVAWASNTFFGRHTPFLAYNRDSLIGRKGASFYRKMMLDDQIRASMHLRRNTIVSRKYRFELTEDSPKQREMEEFFRFNIERFINGAWVQILGNILSSEVTGFSVNEMIFVTDEWRGSPRWLLKAVKPKPFETFTFMVDSFGNVSQIIQYTNGPGVPLDPRKFIIHISNPEVDPVVGESNLKAAYRAYWEKDNILKFWNIYTERLAGGIVLGTIKRTLQTNEINDLKDTLRNLSSSQSIIVPDGVEIDLKMPEDVRSFELAIDNRNLAISRSLLMPNLLGLSPQTRIGALAQSKMQIQIFFQLISLPGNSLADLVNERIFKQLAWWNFGEKEFPRFVFDEFTAEQKRDTVKLWISATEKGVVRNSEKDEERTRTLLDYNERPTGAMLPGIAERQLDEQEEEPEEEDSVDIESLLDLIE